MSHDDAILAIYANTYPQGLIGYAERTEAGDAKVCVELAEYLTKLENEGAGFKCVQDAVFAMLSFADAHGEAKREERVGVAEDAYGNPIMRTLNPATNWIDRIMAAWNAKTEAPV